MDENANANANAFTHRGMYLGDDAEEMECFKNKADFVEVVRCKDCKYKRRCDSYMSCLFDESGFCSYGKRVNYESSTTE